MSKRLITAFILFGVLMALSLYTNNLFVDGMFAASALILVLEVIRDEKKPAKQPVEVPTLVVLYGPPEDTLRTARLFKVAPDRVVLATQPWKLAGLGHCPRIARTKDWSPTARERSLVEQTNRHMESLERIYGIPSYDD